MLFMLMEVLYLCKEVCTFNFKCYENGQKRKVEWQQREQG